MDRNAVMIPMGYYCQDPLLEAHWNNGHLESHGAIIMCTTSYHKYTVAI